MAFASSSLRSSAFVAVPSSPQKLALPRPAALSHRDSCQSTSRVPENAKSSALSTASRRGVQTEVAPQIFELADRGTFIGGTAATMFAMTLIGLAIGFVLLRVEALAEEGKI